MNGYSNEETIRSQYWTSLYKQRFSILLFKFYDRNEHCGAFRKSFNYTIHSRRTDTTLYIVLLYPTVTRSERINN